MKKLLLLFTFAFGLFTFSFSQEYGWVKINTDKSPVQLIYRCIFRFGEYRLDNYKYNE